VTPWKEEGAALTGKKLQSLLAIFEEKVQVPSFDHIDHFHFSPPKLDLVNRQLPAAFYLRHMPRDKGF
jgi:hypothetical protein